MINIDFLNSLRQRKKRVVIISGSLFLILAIFITFSLNSNNDQDTGQVLGETVKMVTTISLGDQNDSLNNITTSGIVRAASQVDIIALNSGTVTSIFFEIGDNALAGQILAQMHNAVALSNFNSASTNFTNTQQNFNLTSQLLKESLRQAELSLKNAEQGVTTAQVALGAAEDNLTNTRGLQAKGKRDTLNNGIVAYYGYINSLNNILNQVNYIIKAEGSSQLPGIAPTLSVLDRQSLYNAETSYLTAEYEYNQIKDIAVSQQDIIQYLRLAVAAMTKTKVAIDDAISVLNNTIPSPTFSELSLNTQKSTYIGLRQSFVMDQTAAYVTLSNLENLDLINKRELDSLQAAFNIAQSQLTSAEINYENAKTAFASAQKTKEQQFLLSQIALAAVQSQFNIASSRLDDLDIRAPIDGTITFKSIQLGQELRPGQKVSEISQSNLVKIIVNLSSDDVYRVKVGQPVMVNDELNGIINTIGPAADPVTRKVKIEILHVNKTQQLIPETFVDVTIPLTNHTAGTQNLPIFVPLKSVVITQTEQFVFIFDNGFAKKVLVETGKIQGDTIQITSGLNYGDELIVTGNKTIKDGQAIGKE